MFVPISPAQARNYSALQLAYIGDAVYNLFVRLGRLKEGKGLRSMHLATTGRVNAAAQAQAVAKLEGILHDDERDIFLRGRNAKPRHQAPRSASCAQYAASTGFEALIGYLYLSGQKTRLEGLLLYLKSCE